VDAFSVGDSVFNGLRLVRHRDCLEITYPDRIHDATAACTLAQAHGLAASDNRDGSWIVRDTVPPGARPERLMTFFAELNHFPAPYPLFTSNNQAAHPEISCIVVVNENRPFVEAQLLPSLALHSKSHRIEVILVSNGSCGEFKITEGVKGLKSEWGSVAAAYNRGAAAASGEYLAFFHDDCIIDDSQWIDKCLDGLREGVTAVAAEYRHLDKVAGVAIPPLTIAKSVPLFLRRQEFIELGGYDEYHYVGFEDLDFTLAMQQRGGKLAYPSIQLRHFNGMSSTLKYCPVEGLSDLYSMAAVPRGAIRQRFKEFAAHGMVRDGVDYLRLVMDVQLLYILKKYRNFLAGVDAHAYRNASDLLERGIVARSPVDATQLVPLFRKIDQIMYNGPEAPA
jgi:glycosyltransferase involved in cell wall biosynthesis